MRWSPQPQGVTPTSHASVRRCSHWGEAQPQRGMQSPSHLTRPWPRLLHHPARLLSRHTASRDKTILTECGSHRSLAHPPTTPVSHSAAPKGLSQSRVPRFPAAQDADKGTGATRTHARTLPGRRRPHWAGSRPDCSLQLSTKSSSTRSPRPEGNLPGPMSGPVCKGGASGNPPGHWLFSGWAGPLHRSAPEKASTVRPEGEQWPDPPSPQRRCA